jgi:hypothetical protein
MAFDQDPASPYTEPGMSRTITTTVITMTTMLKHGGRGGGVFGLDA